MQKQNYSTSKLIKPMTNEDITTIIRKVLSTTEILPPNTACTETYLVAGTFDSEDFAENFYSYLKTKFLRILVSAVKVSQDAMSRTYRFVPVQDFSKPWTDAELYAKYGLSSEEVAFVENMIRPMD